MALKLRVKLALVSLVLLVLPWAGYRYVVEMERFLLASQEQALLATAKAVATALHERPRLMMLSSPLRAPQPKQTDAAEAAKPETKAGQPAAPTPGAAESSTPSSPVGAGPPAASESQPPAPVETAVPMPVEIGLASEHKADSSEKELTDLLRGAQRAGARLWVVNRELKVLAVAGSLKPATTTTPPAWQRWLSWLIQPPAQDFDDAFDEDVLVNGREVTAALLGAGASRVRNTSDGRAVIVSAAYPIWAGDNVVGAVVAEATTNPILSVRNEALESLLVLTTTVIVLVAAVLLGFATRLSSRIRQLRDEAEGAIDTSGRISRLVTASKAGDEIGDLSRSFSTVLTRLAKHHSYLESLASRLSHELRTPVAVVRSSLENLRMEGVSDAAGVYVERAEDGLNRLSRILSRMAEATRLEASLVTQEREPYELTKVVRDCIEGYRLAYPGQAFLLDLSPLPLTVSGSPDLIAQMLDKLVANAVDFNQAGAPVRVELSSVEDSARLCVTNKGSRLPADMAGKLFESMMSIRSAAAGGEPHLGLGLYVARLIAEFHGGTIRAENLPDADGVVVTVTLPLATHSP
jgi:two-component system, OmpR family, sensor histidine kinase ChvG